MVRMEFEEVVNALMAALDSDERTKGRFAFGEIQNTYVFVMDTFLYENRNFIIGRLGCHYEVRFIQNNTYSVEFHVEGGLDVYNRFEKYVQKLQKQNIKGLTVDRRGPNRDGRYFILSGGHLANNLKIDEITTQLKENLLFMEMEIGDKLRTVIRTRFGVN